MSTNASANFKPDFYTFRTREDVETFVIQHPAVDDLQVCDTLYNQLGELMQIRHPETQLTRERRAELIAAHLGESNPVAYGTWVFYPWNHQLVHILGEAEFTEVRTNRNYYKITPEEQKLLAGKKVGVIGLSVGQSVAYAMALERSFGELRLADFDTLDLSNLNRLRAGIGNLGMSKAVICARQLLELDPFLNLKVFDAGITEENINEFLTGEGKLDVLMEECDGLDIKILARHRARLHGIPVIMETNDRGMIDVERFDLEPDRPLLHGLIGDLDPQKLKGLSQEQKIEYLLPMVGMNSLSERMKASMIEVQSSIVSWPQLGSAVMMGGGMAADLGRRVLLGQSSVSGRFYVDMDELVPEPEPEVKPLVHALSPLTREEVLAMVEIYSETETGEVLNTGERLQLVEAAVKAPSGGNMQPWKLCWKDTQLLLFHDPYFSEAFLDFRRLGSYFAFGAMLENIRVAAQHLGYTLYHRTFPDPNQPLLIAACRFVMGAPPPEKGLYDAIFARHTNRMFAERHPLPAALHQKMMELSHGSPTARLILCEDEERIRHLGEILAESEVMLLLHPQGHEEMFHKELRMTEREALETRDGVDVATLKLTKAEVLALRVASSRKAIEWVSKIGGGDAFKKNTRKTISHSSAVGMVTMPFNTPEAYLHAGEFSERLWLLATLHGCSFQPMTQFSFLLARYKHGKGEGYREHEMQLMHKLEDRVVSLFPELRQRELIFLFRVSAEMLPAVRSLRRNLEKVYIY